MANLPHKTLSRARFTRPFRIAKGTLGNGLPTEDIYLSPMHRVLTSGTQINLLFAENEALAAAKFFLHLDGISQTNPRHVRYYHLLFDDHEVVQSAGVWTESLFVGQNGFGGFDLDQRFEFEFLFPELFDECNTAPMRLARRDLRLFEARAAL